MCSKVTISESAFSFHLYHRLIPPTACWLICHKGRAVTDLCTQAWACSYALVLQNGPNMLIQLLKASFGWMSLVLAACHQVFYKSFKETKKIRKCAESETVYRVYAQWQNIHSGGHNIWYASRVTRQDLQVTGMSRHTEVVFETIPISSEQRWWLTGHRQRDFTFDSSLIKSHILLPTPIPTELLACPNHSSGIWSGEIKLADDPCCNHIRSFALSKRSSCKQVWFSKSNNDIALYTTCMWAAKGSLSTAPFCQVPLM